MAREGFAPFSARVDVASALPTDFHVTLALAPVQTQVTVTADDTLLDVHRAAAAQRIGADALRQRTMALPGRSVPELVNTQPGWLLEANGILHPRGSEYQTQYVIDGLPLTDNRSPAFAPELDPDEIQTMNIVTGGYPAEYGRKLGGVIEVVTAAQAQRGFHGNAGLSIGSFSTKSGDAIGEYAGERTTMSAAVGVAATDRYLDPPVAENFTNRGTTTHAAVHVERELTGADRVGVIVRRGEARFLVPNEQVQQQAGQRQDRDSGETAAQFSYQHLFSAPVLADVRGMTRDLSAGLWSNDSATPIAARQDRGFRELYLKAAASGHAGAHEWKAGGDMSLASVHERFAYRITDAALFNPGTPADFSFDERRADREVALFAQHQIRTERWTINAGLRWAGDQPACCRRAVVAVGRSRRARLLRSGVSDAGRREPAAGELARGRCVERSDPSVAGAPLARELLRGRRHEIDVRPAAPRCDVVRAPNGQLRRRRPPAEHRCQLSHRVPRRDDSRDRAEGRRAALEIVVRIDRLRVDARPRRSADHRRPVPRRRGELAARVDGPVSDLAGPAAHGSNEVSVSTRAASAVTIALAGAYGSGLPFEFAGDRSDALGLYGERIVDRVDFDDGRVRPSWSPDGSVGIVVAKRPHAAVRVQADVRNLTNRLNVINFAGLFSGTAVGQPRSVAVRIRAEF